MEMSFLMGAVCWEMFLSPLSSTNFCFVTLYSCDVKVFSAVLTDVDECAEELHGCHPEDETCRNTVGAYECDMACDEGFQFNLILRTCVGESHTKC